MLASNSAHEQRVTASEAVAFDEIADVGEAWAFQVEPDRILFLGPRQDLPRGFPTTDFSHVRFHDAAGNLVDIGYFHLRGERLSPARRIPAEAQGELDLSRAPEILSGRLERLETLLRSG